MKRQPCALLMTTQAYSAHGGVQSYSRRLGEVMSAWSDSRCMALNYVSLLDTDYVDGLHSQPARYEHFGGAGGSKPRFVKMAASMARQGHPAVAVVAHIGIAPVALMLKAAGWLRSYIVVLHGIEAWDRVGAADRAAARAASTIVATTAYTAERFADNNGIAPELLKVVPLALPYLEVEPTDERTGFSSGTLRVLSVGRLAASDAYKGYDVLIEAVGRARRCGARIELSIVGDGDDSPRLKERARNLGLAAAVQFAGSVSDARLREEFSQCDVFALPSRSEGFGIVFLEAMRFGKPCIGGNHGGTPEVIGHGVDGFLVEHGDADALAERLMQLWKEPELRKTMGERAREKVKNAYLFPHMRDRWLSVLDCAAGVNI
ncbi:MAG TPA: glycosyltransferase family 4 protein [Bryobacteraceae bacterium]|nr:glycosyltransferase family 4 protein [Bryobacteraceae bacterium]